MNFTSNVKQHNCKSYLDWSQRGGRVQCRHQSNTKQDDDARLDDNVSVANFGLRVDQHEGA